MASPGSARSTFSHRHLLGIEDLSREDVLFLLERAEELAKLEGEPEKKLSLLKGRTVINLFLEASTRTRTSFEIAAKRLSADAVNVSGASSSTTKGETLLDTAKNLDAMAPDVIVLRHAVSGAAAFIAEHVRAAVVNAGDGLHEHPSQALLDAATIRSAKGRIEGLEIVICGDITHSRVARSNLHCLTKLGARVRIVGMRTLVPRGIETLVGPLADRVTVFHSLDEALEGADVVMMLRIQTERLSQASLFPTSREYSRTFGLNAARLARTKPDAIVMHPGPVNRGVELAPDVADGVRSHILDQVRWGVAVRMAILATLGAPKPATPKEAP